KWSQGPYNMLPIVLKQPFTDDFAIQSWERMWTDKHRNAFVLESGKGGRYTYLGLNPSSIIHGKGEDCVISDDQGIHSKIKSPLKAVQDWLQQVKAPSV